MIRSRPVSILRHSTVSANQQESSWRSSSLTLGKQSGDGRKTGGSTTEVSQETAGGAESSRHIERRRPCSEEICQGARRLVVGAACSTCASLEHGSYPSPCRSSKKEEHNQMASSDVADWKGCFQRIASATRLKMRIRKKCGRRTYD